MPGQVAPQRSATEEWYPFESGHGAAKSAVKAVVSAAVMSRVAISVFSKQTSDESGMEAIPRSRPRVSGKKRSDWSYNETMANEYELRKQLIEVCRRLYDRELIVAMDGNVSCRMGPNRFLTTPSGVCKGDLTPDRLVVVDAHGKKLAGSLKPSSEFGMHAAIYEVRADVSAVVHAHPPTATAFSVAGASLASPILTEVVLTLGAIPTAPYATPGTPEVAAGVRQLITTYDCCILDHHGVVTVGRDLLEAFYRMETVEQTAKVALAAHTLGGSRALGPAQVGALQDTRRALGLREIPVLGVSSPSETGIRSVELSGRLGRA